MSQVSVLKSVFFKKVGTNWEPKLFWRDLDYEGKRLLIHNELDDVIQDDFETDRYLISRFLDHNMLWDKFDTASQSLGINSTLLETVSHGDRNFEGWMTDSENFTLSVFYKFIHQLDIYSEFKSFIFRERLEHHEDCCNCGFPIIIPEVLHAEILNHIVYVTEY